MHQQDLPKKVSSSSNKIASMLKRVVASSVLSSLEKKRLDAKIHEFIGKIELNINKKNIKARVLLGGSAAKGTLIKGDFDCDIFVAFDSALKNYNISKMLFDLIKRFNFQTLHGSRDYYSIKYNGVNFEIVPVLDITSSAKAENVTDMSPLHVKWIMRKLKNDPGFSDQIILAKIFCKAQGLYGAESYIKGFSGHVLDILTIYYGGFIPLLRAAKDWKVSQVIDVENFYKNKDVKKVMNSSKIQSPLIVVDPIMPERNASASLSKEKFFQFKKKAELFLNRPSESFFHKKPLTSKDMLAKHKGRKLIEIRLSPLEGKPDVIGSKILKCLEYMQIALRLNDFNVLDFQWQWDKMGPAVAFFVFSKKPLSRKKKWIGPPMGQKQHVIIFKKKHKETFVEKGKVCALVPRDFIIPDALLKSIVLNPYVKERTKRVTIKVYR